MKLHLYIAADLKQVCQRLGKAHVLVAEEGGGQALFARAARAPDAVDIIVNVSGEVKIDDVGDMGDVQATRSHVRRHKDGRAARAKAP